MAAITHTPSPLKNRLVDWLDRWPADRADAPFAPFAPSDGPARSPILASHALSLACLVVACATLATPVAPASLIAHRVALALLVWPLAAQAASLRRTLRRERVAILGTGGEAEAIARQLVANGIACAGPFAPDEAGVDGLCGLAERTRLDRVLVAGSGSGSGAGAGSGPAPTRLPDAIAALDVEICAAARPGSACATRPALDGASQAELRLAGVCLELLAARPLPGWGRAVKRGADLVCATLLLLTTAPLLVAIACAVRLDGGPVLFVQEREGRNLRPFRIWKFRTMRAGCAARIDGALCQTVRGDARITPIGRFLRRSSLDELPQLFNVLRGEMSLIGPRPHAPGMLIEERRAAPDVAASYARRHRVRPGMSGLAQISDSRGALADLAALSTRTALDLHYVEHWSVWLDLRIALATPWRLMFPRGAAF